MKKNLPILLIIAGIFIVSVILSFIIIEDKELDSTGTISKVNYSITQNCGGGRYDLSRKGYYVDTFNSPNAPYLYIISMGQKSTGGYSIEIVDLKIDKDKNVKVTVKEKEPKEEITTMALTTPTVCLQLSNYAKTIEIKNTDGEVFQELNY